MITSNRQSSLRLPLMFGALLLTQGCVEVGGASYYVNLDGDLVYDQAVYSAEQPDGWTEGAVAGDADCDTGDGTIYQGAPDAACDGVDNDCDGEIDEDYEGPLYYADADGDNYGAGAGQCAPGDGLVEQGGDCDDEDPAFSPEAVDVVCSDGVDHDCDGEDDCALEGVKSVSGLLERRGGWQVPGASVAVITGTGEIAIGDPNNHQVLVVDAALGTTLATLTGADLTQFGAAVAAGDFDGVGGIDLAVGAPGEDTGAGKIRLYHVGDEEAFSVVSPKTDHFSLGGIVQTIPGGAGADSLAVADYIVDEDDAEAFSVYVLTAFAASDTTDSGTKVTGSFTADDWSLTLAAASDGSALAVGYSNVTSSGSQVYGIPYTSGDPVDVLFSTTTTDTFLGASVALEDVGGSDLLDLLVGAPGEGTVYGLKDPTPGTNADPTDATLTWTSTTDDAFGAGIGLLGDLTGETDGTLAIGGATTLSLFRPSGTTFDTTAAATITGFAGPVRTILNPGDIDSDGFDDVLVCDGTNVTLLFGGPLPHVEQTE